jgi:hypothetical protein
MWVGGQVAIETDVISTFEQDEKTHLLPWFSGACTSLETPGWQQFAE